MTDIVEVLNLKLTTARSQVERHVLTRARDEIIKLRDRVTGLNLIQDQVINDTDQYKFTWTS